jgi:hypothetical protein
VRWIVRENLKKRRLRAIPDPRLEAWAALVARP